MTLFLELFGVGVLILLNAFFVAAEYGLVTARRTRIIELHHQGDRRARAALRITSDPPQFIASMKHASCSRIDSPPLPCIWLVIPSNVR